MKTLLSSGDLIQLTATGTFTSGTGLLTNQLFGVPENSGVSGDLITLRVSGVVALAKTSALAISVGDALYWDDTNKVVNKTSSGQKEVGYAVSDAANPSSTVNVRLTPTIRTSVAA